MRVIEIFRANYRCPCGHPGEDHDGDGCMERYLVKDPCDCLNIYRQGVPPHV